MKAYKQHKCSELENFRLQYLPFFCFGRFLTNLYSACLYGFYCNWHIVAFDGSSVSVIQVWMSAPKWHVCHFSLLIFGDIKRTKNKNIYKKKLWYSSQEWAEFVAPIGLYYSRHAWVLSVSQLLPSNLVPIAFRVAMRNTTPLSSFITCHLFFIFC